MPKVLNADDRLDLIVRLAENYPDATNANAIGIDDPEILRGTLTYLEQRGFVKVDWIAAGPGQNMPTSVSLTARGYDEAEDSGALGN